MLETRDTYIRTRLSERTRADFDAVCKTINITPSEQLRILIEKFLEKTIDATRARSVVHIYRPEGYDLGAWRITITLSNPSDGLWNEMPFPFKLPELSSRRIASDKENLAVVNDGGKIVIGGKFDHAGIWRGHLYSNGIAEDENPTSIDEVRDVLHDTVKELLERIHGAPGQGPSQSFSW